MESFPALKGTSPGDVSADSTLGDSRSADPEDYLEKIFQIPFQVNGLDDLARKKIVNGLLGSHVIGQSQATPVSQIQNQLWVTQFEPKAIEERITPRSTPLQLAVSALSVTTEELDFIDSVAPLMGSTPRSVKRLVNVYQLIRLLWSKRADPPAKPYSDENVLAFLLAISEGFPELAKHLYKHAKKNPQHTLGDFLITPTAAGGQRFSVLSDWCNDNPKWKGLPLHQVTEQQDDVGRFLFRQIAN